MEYLAKLYVSAGADGQKIRDNARNPVFVDLFSGTGSMSKCAKRMGFRTVISLDKEYDADYQCDIMELDHEHELALQLDKYKTDGRIIIFHASPPCDQFSKMNTQPHKDIAGAMAMVKAAHKFMCKHSLVWCLENPATGSLWIQPDAVDRFTHYHDLDYCAYGGMMKKATRFAFSSGQLKTAFVPKRCPGKDVCSACYLDTVSNRMRHVSMETLPYEERIAIPDQVCLTLIKCMREYVIKFADKLADFVDRMLAEKEVERELERATLKRKRKCTSTAYYKDYSEGSMTTEDDVSRDDNADSAEAEDGFTSPIKVLPSCDFVSPRSCVVFVCDPIAEPAYKFSPYNLNVAGIDEDFQLRAFKVETCANVKLGSKELCLLYGQFYERVFTRQYQFECIGEPTHIVVPRDDILQSYTLNDTEMETGTLRITAKKQQMLKDVFDEMV